MYYMYIHVPYTDTENILPGGGDIHVPYTDTQEGGDIHVPYTDTENI